MFPEEADTPETATPEAPQVNLDNPTPAPTVNIDSGVAVPQPPSEEVAKTRAYKAHMGIGDVVKMDYDELYRNIADGKEDALRKEAAFAITSKGVEDQQKALVDLAASKGSALTFADVQKLAVPPADPKSVIEQSYARAYVNTGKDAATRIEDNVITDAQAQNPDALDAYFNKGSDLLSKREYALTAVQNLQPEVEKNDFWTFKEPFFDTDVKIAKINSYDMKQLVSLGFYESAVLRGNTKNTSRLGFLGNVLDEQAKELLDLPQDQYYREFDRIQTNLKSYDPVLAQKFANAVAGMSTSDKFVDNAMETVNVAMAGSIASGLRASLRAGVDARLGVRANAATDRGGLAQGADGVYRATGSTPDSNTEVTVTGPGAQAQAQQAVKDIVQSANVPTVTKATIAEGAGDVKEAAVQKTVESIVTDPNPIRDAQDTLFSMHRAVVKFVEDNPGNLSREEHTRLLDAAQGYEKKATDLIINTTKVVRTPLIAEQGFRDAVDRIADYFPGRENTIGDVNVRHDTWSNTTWFDTDVLNYDGLPFSSPELAANHARINNYGEPIIVGSAPKKLYIPAAAAKNLESVQTTPEGTKFFVDKGIEVMSRVYPDKGDIPYNLETSKFEPAVVDSPVVKQKGLGFRLVVSIPFDETQSFVRRGLITERKAMSTSNDETRTATKVGNAIFGYVRNPYDTLSKIENENRAKVVFTQAKFINFIKQELKDVEDIYKGIFKDGNILVHKPLSYLGSLTGENRTVADQFTRALVASQTLPDKAGLHGYYMQSPAEIQHYWLSNYQRPASFKEQQAYLAIGRLDHFDHVLRSLIAYKYKARLGVAQHTFYTTKDGVRTPSPTFEARMLKKVPGGEDVTLIHSFDGSETYWHNMNPERQAIFRKAVEKGEYKGGEIYNPELRPITRADKDGNPLRIRYVFSDAMETKPITYDQMGYRGGGHWEYDHEHAVKQAIVRPQWVGGKFQHQYEGDSTFGFVSNRAMGEDFAKHMNSIADLIRAKDIKGAKAYSRNVFDIEWKKLYGGFRPSKNPITGEVMPPRFSLKKEQEFRVVPKGKMIADLDKKLEEKYTNKETGVTTFVNGTKHGSLARNFQVAFSQPRESYDLMAPTNVGTPDKPFYNFRPAQLTDPIVTMTRALDRIVNSLYMDDYKISATEHWLQENMGLLEDPIRQVQASPFWYFNEGKMKTNPDTLLQRMNAESNRYKIKELLGTPSKIDTALHGIKQTISDSLYQMGRDNLVNIVDTKIPDTVAGKIIKAPLLAPEWLLDRVHNPVDFLRAMAYHTYLGLFNWVQIFAQNASYSTIFALADVNHAAAGSMGALMHQWSRINKHPNIIASMDAKATLFGWRPGEFTEAMKYLDRSGFGQIANEISLDNGLHKQSFFRKDGKAFLDAGQVFFHGSNRNVRFGAWYTAFYEFRQKNPLMKIGPVQEGQILYRANFLNTLMTRDANTMLNKGIVGVSLQFFDYMKKLGDVFYSPNTGETMGRRSYIRAKMFMINALLFGAVGATGLSLIPGGDMIRKEALKQGYVIGENVWSTLAMEGPLSMVGAYLSGFGDMSKGTFYNFNNRFGANGYQVLRDLLEPSTTFWKVVGGAAGTEIGTTLSSLSPFTNAMYSMIQGDPSKEAWPLKVDDWIAPLNSISSWKYGRRLEYALAFGKWLDSHGRPVSDVSKIDAFFRTLTGLNDQRVDDIYLRNQIIKERKEGYERAFNEYEEQRRHAEQAAAQGDKEQADDYNKRAFFALTSNNVPTDMWSRAFSRDAELNKDTISKNNESYFLKFVPTDKQDAYREAFRKIQQMKDNH